MSLKLVSKLALAAFATLSLSLAAHAGDGNIAQQSGKGYMPPPSKGAQQFNKGKNSQAPVQSQSGKGSNFVPPVKGKGSNKPVLSSGNNGGNSSGNNGGNTTLGNRNQ
jgi:hypothetical protein